MEKEVEMKCTFYEKVEASSAHSEEDKRSIKSEERAMQPQCERTSVPPPAAFHTHPVRGRGPHREPPSRWAGGRASCSPESRA